MKLQVEWDDPVALRPIPRQAPMYSVDLEKVPDEPGVYVLGRKWGTGFEAIYVGKALNIRTRVKGQLNNLRLMRHLHDAKTGARVVVPGRLITKRGQQVERCLPIVERTCIRHFLSDGHHLVNIQGTLLRQHEVESVRRPWRFVPPVMYLDRSRV
jgi:hypothetical protein